jgi:hypothetical protein
MGSGWKEEVRKRKEGGGEERGGSRKKTHLHQSPLNLSIGRSTLTKPPTSDGINLIHENDTWFMFFCIGKHFSNHSRGFTNVFVDNLGLARFEREASEGNSGKGSMISSESLRGDLGVQGYSRPSSDQGMRYKEQARRSYLRRWCGEGGKRTYS